MEITSTQTYVTLGRVLEHHLATSTFPSPLVHTTLTHNLTRLLHIVSGHVQGGWDASTRHATMPQHYRATTLHPPGCVCVQVVQERRLMAFFDSAYQVMSVCSSSLLRGCSRMPQSLVHVFVYGDVYAATSTGSSTLPLTYVLGSRANGLCRIARGRQPPQYRLFSAARIATGRTHNH